MGNLIVPNCVRVEPIFVYLGQHIENVYHVTKGSPATVGDLNQIAAIQEGWERNSAKQLRSLGVGLTHIDVTALDGPTAPTIRKQPDIPAITGTANNPMSPILTVAITHRTGLQGRSFRGRSYWIGLFSNGTSSVELINTTTQTNLVNAYNTLRAAYLAAGWTMVVLSLYSGVDADGRAIRRAVPLMTPIISHSCDLYIDTNRHRKIRPPS